MSEEQKSKFNAYLASWLRGNKYLRKYTTSYASVLMYDGEHVIINLNLLSDHYHQKFITGKLGAYANSLLSVLTPSITDFFIAQNISSCELAFHFNDTTGKMAKYVQINSGSFKEASKAG